MQEIFKRIKDNNCHAITILPSVEEGKESIIQGLVYNEQGEKIGGSSMGDMFHITMFRDSEEGFTDKESFEAILVCPYTYSEKLMKDGWFGMIAMKTSTSQDIIDKFNMLVDDVIAQGA